MNKKKFNLERFVLAQDRCYEEVIGELQAGRKRTHWIWYIFPQIKGLGISYNSEFYGIENIEEAKAYIEHPLLGKRLLECTNILLNLESDDIHIIMGYPDDLKLKSSMSLFSIIEEHPFTEILNKFFHGQKDFKTISRINKK